jgi:hypothetical protein
LVCWSEKNGHAEVKHAITCERRRIFSLATLLTNSPEPTELDTSIRRSDRFVSELDQLLEPIDHGQNWTPEQMNSEDFQNRVIEIALRALTGESCGLRRIRFWLRTQATNHEFTINRSVCSPKASPLKQEMWDQYTNKGIVTNEADPYCKYTIARAREQPFAELQHMSMFDGEDLNWRELKKCKEGKWFVAPIASRGKVYGFISADNHIELMQNGQAMIVEERVPEQVLEMQKCAIDVIVRLIENLVRIKFNASRSKKRVADS